jgi:molecular chaperone DnaJ
MSDTDLYNTLGIDKNASTDDIRKAFKKAAIANHPDKNPGDKEKEELFKKASTAYEVLSNPEKKQLYDNFGVIDGQSQPNNQNDINDILKNVFGGMGMSGQMPGGFQFSFQQGGNSPEDIFGSLFGGNRRHQQPQNDLLDIEVDICDLYYGKTKKVEFELLELCSKCEGSGASDPNQIIKCITCKGQGCVMHQLGPFIQKTSCPSCSGNGTCIKKACSSCQGKKTVYNKKLFELKLPKGVPNDHTVTMSKKGSYDVNTKQVKDIIFKFKHKIEKPYELDDNMNVIYNINITIEELLSGFSKKIKLYNEDTTVGSNKYFNPNNVMIIKEKGLFNMKKNKQSDLHLKFSIDFIDSDKLVKYKEVFHKIFKIKENDENIEFNLNDY